MFYSGGARKKNAIREILKKVSKPKQSRDREDDREDDRNYNFDDVSDASDTSEEQNMKLVDYNSDNSNDDNENDPPDICITTLGSHDTRHYHYRYAFIDNELDYNIEEFSEKHPSINQYKFIIYQINTSASTPFLEFLTYCDTDAQNPICQFPYYQHSAKQHIRKEIDGIMNKLFTRKYRYRGFFGHDNDSVCFIFYEVYFNKKESRLRSLHREQDYWHWVTTPEIIYHHKYVTIPIDETVVELFHIYPTIGVLQATPNTDRTSLLNIELPTIAYYGSDICYAKNTAIYGLKREPIISRYGPFFYFTTIEHSYYWACYHFPSKKRTGPNNNKSMRVIRNKINGGISRYAIFTKRMKTVFIDDDYDDTNVKKYVDRKNIFQTKINDYRHNLEVYTPNIYNVVYSHGYEWTEKYDTIYNGLYNVNNKYLMPVWCVKDHKNFTLLSYYEVKTGDGVTIPLHYDEGFNEYTIL